MSVAAAPTAEPPADTDAVPAADQATTFLNLYLREREKRVRLERELKELDGAVAALSARLDAGSSARPPEELTGAELLTTVNALAIKDPELREAHREAVRLREEVEDGERADFAALLTEERDDG